MPRAVAIYARISEDRDGRMLGVERQLKDCRERALRRGWPVIDEYIDDDVSAYGGKPRPAYSRLLEDITSGRIDGVVVWDLDRLHRHPRELEEFFRVCETAGVSHLASYTGDVDLGTHDGQFTARILGAVAKKESDDKSRRLKRKHLEIAQAGRPAGGRRPYGYDEQRQIIPHEAAVIREAARRVRAGESLRTLVREFDARGVATARGARWSMHALRGILLNPGLAGVRTLGGAVVGPAVWEAILTEEESAQLRAVLTDPARRVTRPLRRYLLTGLVYCSYCGTKLIARPNHHRRTYVCGSGPALAGCGKISIVADHLEAFVTEAVMRRLDGPELAAALTEKGNDPDEELLETISADEAQLEELSGAWANRLISMPEWLRARKAIEDRLAQERSQLLRRDRHQRLRDAAGKGGVLREQWADMNLDQRRAVIGTILDRLVVKPARVQGRTTSEHERVAAEWKL